MSEGPYTIHRRALAAYHDLPVEERAALESALACLARTPPARWHEAGARKLTPEESIYLLLINGSLRAIVQPGAEGEPEVLALVRHDTLQTFTPAAS